MKKTALALLVLIASACHQPSQSRRVGINLGTQAAPITLASGNNNNVNVAPNGSVTTFIRFLVNSSGSTLTGMQSGTANVADGDQFWIRNDSSTGNLTITNEDSNSSAANRFLTPGAVSLVMPPRSALMVEWDVTAGRWMASDATPSNPFFTGTVTTTGNVVATGSATPTLSTCGTSPSITANSTNFSGTYTTGSGATTCTLTFAGGGFTNAPSCLIVNNTAATALVPTYSESATALTVTVDVASTAYRYICVGH